MFHEIMTFTVPRLSRAWKKGRGFVFGIAIAFVMMYLLLSPQMATAGGPDAPAPGPVPAPAPSPAPPPVPLPTLDPALIPTAVPPLFPTPDITLDVHATAVPAAVVTGWALHGYPTSILTPVTVGTPRSVHAGAGAGTDGSGDSGIVQSITRAFYTIIFPVESMEDALRGVMTNFFSGSIEASENVFAEAVDAIVLPEEGGFTEDVDGADVYRAPWIAILKISAALWPLTFVIVLTGAAKESLITSSPVGFADTKKGLLDWIISVAMAAGSLIILTWVNELFQEITSSILMADFGIFQALDAHAITGTLLNTQLLMGFTQLVPFGGLFIGFFLIILAFSVLISLFLVYVSKYALLFVLVVIAPFVLTVSVVPPVRWLNWTWIKGYVLVCLLGPVNALLLKLAALATIQQAGAAGHLSVLPATVHFFKMLGVLSLLLTINFTVAKMSFGAINEIKDKALDATKAVVGAIVTAATVGAAALGGAAIGGGALAGGAAGGGGAAAGGGGAAAAGGGAAGAGEAAAGSQAAADAGATGASSNAGGSAMRDATTQIGDRAGAATRGTRLKRVQSDEGDESAQTGGGGDNAITDAVTSADAQPADQDSDAGGGPVAAGGGGEQSGGATQSGGGRLAGALQVGGATLSSMSKGRFGRGVGAAARAAGWMMERQTDAGQVGGQQPAFRSGSMDTWRSIAAGLGASSRGGEAAVTGPLSQLADQYGTDAVRSAARDTLGPAVAARRFGNETAPSMTTQDGFYTRDASGQPQADVRSWIGSTVESRLRTMPGGANTGPAIFPSSPPSSPATSTGVGSTPSLVDFRQGAQMAQALGYEATDQDAIRGLASLHHLHRNPRHGFDAGSAQATVRAAWSAQAAFPNAARTDGGLESRYLPDIRAEFMTNVRGIAAEHGQTNESAYPSAWTDMAANIRSGAWDH